MGLFSKKENKGGGVDIMLLTTIVMDIIGRLFHKNADKVEVLKHAINEHLPDDVINEFKGALHEAFFNMQALHQAQLFITIESADQFSDETIRVWKKTATDPKPILVYEWYLSKLSKADLFALLNYISENKHV
ncbi:MAG: hypothetical protein EBX41_00770 [Chitinophagia bacterium]|nr:hypothetical protein [Chitinophagia bacterium]